MAKENYSEEFKADAVALFLSTPSATYVSVARDLGVSLGDHLAGCPATLELQDVQVANLVHAQQIDSAAVRRRDLTADDQQRIPQDGRILLDQVLQLLLQLDPGRVDLLRPSAVDPPQPHFDRHNLSLTRQGGRCQAECALEAHPEIAVYAVSCCRGEGR